MLRAGLVGYGYAGRTIHAPLIAATPGFELAAVCSSDPAKVGRDHADVAVVAEPAALRPASTSWSTSRSRSRPPRRAT